MSDIVIDRNQRFDLIAKLAASANGISPQEQEAVCNAIEVQLDHVAGSLRLENDLRRAAANAKANAAAETAARLKAARRKRTTTAKTVRKRSR